MPAASSRITTRGGHAAHPHAQKERHRQDAGHADANQCQCRLVGHERGSGDDSWHRDRDAGTTRPGRARSRHWSGRVGRPAGSRQRSRLAARRGRLAARAARRAESDRGRIRAAPPRLHQGDASSSSSCQASALSGSSAGRKGSSSLPRDGRTGGSNESAATLRVGSRGRSPVTGRYGSYGAIGRAAGGKGELPDARSCPVSLTLGIVVTGPGAATMLGHRSRSCLARGARACLRLTSSPRFQDSMVDSAARGSATRRAYRRQGARPVLTPGSPGAEAMSAQAMAAPRREARSRRRTGSASAAASRSRSARHAAPRASALQPPAADD